MGRAEKAERRGLRVRREGAAAGGTWDQDRTRSMHTMQKPVSGGKCRSMSAGPPHTLVFFFIPCTELLFESRLVFFLLADY